MNHIYKFYHRLFIILCWVPTIPIIERDINMERKILSYNFISLQQLFLLMSLFEAIGKHFQIPQLYNREFTIAIAVQLIDFRLFYKTEVDVLKKLHLVKSDFYIIAIYIISMTFGFWVYFKI